MVIYLVLRVRRLRRSECGLNEGALRHQGGIFCTLIWLYLNLYGRRSCLLGLLQRQNFCLSIRFRLSSWLHLKWAEA